MENLFKRKLPEYARIHTYADDKVLIVTADTKVLRSPQQEVLWPKHNDSKLCAFSGNK